jgi:hypothetical protein
VFEKRQTFVDTVSLQHDGVVVKLHPAGRPIGIVVEVSDAKNQVVAHLHYQELAEVSSTGGPWLSGSVGQRLVYCEDHDWRRAGIGFLHNAMPARWPARCYLRRDGVAGSSYLTGDALMPKTYLGDGAEGGLVGQDVCVRSTG